MLQSTGFCTTASYAERMPTFLHDGHRIAYSEHGSGDKVVVLVHGLLFSQKLMTPLARRLGRRGYRAVTIDLLGHGRSDRPSEMQAYSMAGFGEQIIGLLDHLEVDKAVIHGLSLGANSALEAAVAAPQRIQGLVIEMPVLDNALLGCAIAFTPLMLTLSFGRRPMRALSAITRRIPTSAAALSPLDLALDLVRQDPGPSNAVFHGLFFHRVAPTPQMRRTISAPTLVVGHRNDPIHPFSDADELVGEVHDGRLLRMGSILEGRLFPERISSEIEGFLAEAFARPSAAVPQRERLESA